MNLQLKKIFKPKVTLFATYQIYPVNNHDNAIYFKFQDNIAQTIEEFSDAINPYIEKVILGMIKKAENAVITDSNYHNKIVLKILNKLSSKKQMVIENIQTTEAAFKAALEINILDSTIAVFKDPYNNYLLDKTSNKRKKILIKYAKKFSKKTLITPPANDEEFSQVIEVVIKICAYYLYLFQAGSEINKIL